MIHAEFELWLAQLDVEMLRRLNVGSLDAARLLANTTLRIEASLPLFPRGTVALDILRRLGLSDQARDRLMVLFAKIRPKIVGPSDLRGRITKKKQVWVEVHGDNVTLGVRLPGGSLRTGVFDALGVREAPGHKHRLDPVPDFERLLEYCAAHKPEFARTVKPPGPGPTDPPPLPKPTLSELHYPPGVAARLLQMHGSESGKPGKGADLSIRFRRRMADGANPQILRIDLVKGGGQLRLKFDASLATKFAQQFPTLLLKISKDRKWRHSDSEQEMTDVLDWIAGQLPKIYTVVRNSPGPASRVVAGGLRSGRLIGEETRWTCSNATGGRCWGWLPGMRSGRRWSSRYQAASTNRRHAGR